MYISHNLDAPNAENAPHLIMSHADLWLCAYTVRLPVCTIMPEAATLYLLERSKGGGSAGQHPQLWNASRKL